MRNHSVAVVVALAVSLAGHAAAAPSRLATLLDDRFGTDAGKRAAAANALERVRPNTVARQLAWKSFQTSPVHGPLRDAWDNKTVTTPDRSSPYLWRYVGTRQADGWGLVIAMHGGGNAPKEVNDQQWQHMFSTYYRDHPESGGYVYLALRAPNDTWNGFYDDAICPLVESLIKQFVLFGDVNPDRVYILGASHGGYGAFVIGPKIPYRFAAVHAAASAPTDGETMGENLRDVRFTFMVGERDTAYGRAERDQTFAHRLVEWRKKFGGYSSAFDLVKDTGHQVPDHDKLAEMLTYRRDSWPKHVIWTQTDAVLNRFYWLEALKPAVGGHIEANVSGNTITILADKQEQVALWLDGTLVDLRKPVIVELSGAVHIVRAVKPRPTLETYCLGLERTADPKLSAPIRVVVSTVPADR